MSDIERGERERKCAERGRALLSKYEISEEARKEEIQEIKQELNELAIKVGLRTRPNTLKEALGSKEKKGEKDVAVFPTSTE